MATNQGQSVEQNIQPARVENKAPGSTEPSESAGTEAAPRQAIAPPQPRRPSRHPLARMRSMMDELERFFDAPFFGGSSRLERFFDEGPGWPTRIQGGSFEFWAPDVDVFERGDQWVVRADLPGLEPKDIHLEIRDGYLLLSGERLSEREERPAGGARFERSYGSFRRTIPLPEAVDPDAAKAEMRNGVLEVSFKMPEGGRARRIEIQSGEQAGEPQSKDQKLH